MWNFFRQLGAGIAQTWQNLTISARINILLTLIATVGLLVAAIVVGGRPQYTVLYSGLEKPDEISQIQTLLAEEGVPYKITDGGATIRVPDRDVGRLRVALRARGLPTVHGLGPGWDLLDKQSIWTSPEAYATSKQRAIQGELQRMLNQLDFVDRSFVYIHEAKESLFKKDQRPSEAAVTLAVSRRPTKMEIEAVLGIVSTFGGVNLDRSHITLATTDGVLLHSPAKDEIARVASSKHEVIEQLEKQREQKITDAFARLGRKVIPMVSAKLDFSAKEVSEDLVLEGVELSTKETTSETVSTESLPEGAAGTYSNLPEGVPGPRATQTTETTQDTLTNMEPSRTRRVTRTEAGDVLEYKVSAIIDWGNRPVLNDEGVPTGEQEYGPPTEDELDQFRRFIASAVGPEVNVEDVHVFAQAFQIDQLREAKETFAVLEQAQLVSALVQWGGYVLKAVLVLVGFWLARRALLRIMAATPLEEEEELELPKPTSEEMRKREIAAEVESLSERQPEAVASLLRAWMTEGEE